MHVNIWSSIPTLDVKEHGDINAISFARHGRDPNSVGTQCFEDIYSNRLCGPNSSSLHMANPLISMRGRYMMIDWDHPTLPRRVNDGVRVHVIDPTCEDHV